MTTQTNPFSGSAIGARRGRRMRPLAGVCGLAVVALIGGSLNLAPALASAAPSSATVIHRQLASLGTVNVRQIAARQAGHPTMKGRLMPSVDHGGNVATTVPPPNPPVRQLVQHAGGAHGFVGITDLSQAFGIGNGGFTDLEPPDQGLCAHGGLVVEVVNLGLQIYTEAGQALTPVVGLSTFFGLPPPADFSTSPPTFGPFLSDPRCYYDAQTGRWFVTILEIDVNPQTGQLASHTHELLAVSQTSDPLAGYHVFSIDSTNDGSNGTPVQPNCPCLGDQPRIGADANGFYIADDSYPIPLPFNSNGGELYALSKTGLAAAANGAAPPTLVDIHNGAVVIGGYPANAVQPAQTPEGGGYAPNREYFLSTPDFNGFATAGGAGAAAVVLWSLTGTNTLSNVTPDVTLTHALLPSEAYAPPVNAAQRPGPLPFGASLPAPEEPLSVNDDRMQQVEFVNGRLYSSLNTGVGPRKGANRSGVAWFVVTPQGAAGSVSHQGYVALGAGASLMYPAIGLTPQGEGVMTFSISGPKSFPSSAFMHFQNGEPTGAVYVTSAGTAPEDGFTCYPQIGFGPPCRWGDYSAASSDGAGNIVMGAELIPDTARLFDANWGTFVSVLTP